MATSDPVGENIEKGELEHELYETHKRIIFNKKRLDLVQTLLKMGLCTGDIYAFVCSQTDLCVSNSTPDRGTVTKAMRAKIRDITQTLKNDHREKKVKEKELLRLLGGRSWALRKRLRPSRIA